MDTESRSHEAELNTSLCKQAVVGVVMPIRNEVSTLHQSLQAVLRQQDVDLQCVVLVIAPSDDGTWELAHRIAESDSRVKVLPNPTGLTPVGMNLGIDFSSRYLEQFEAPLTVIARVDARAVLPPRYLAHALATLIRYKAGNVGAVQNPIGRSPKGKAIAAAMASRLGNGGAAYRRSSDVDLAPQKVDTAWLGVFDLQALRAVGGYDELSVRNQDAELNHRLNAAGFPVYLDPQLIVDYGPRETFKGLASQFFQYGGWRFRTAHKHSSLAPRQLAAPAVVAVLAASIGLCLRGVIGFTRSKKTRCAAFNALAGSGDKVSVLVPMAAPVAYIALLSAEAARSERELSMQQRAQMAFGLATMHISWGAGFWSAALRLIVGKPLGAQAESRLAHLDQGKPDSGG